MLTGVVFHVPSESLLAWNVFWGGGKANITPCFAVLGMAQCNAKEGMVMLFIVSKELQWAGRMPWITQST